jgi:hypothetical protein
VVIGDGAVRVARDPDHKVSLAVKGAVLLGLTSFEPGVNPIPAVRRLPTCLVHRRAVELVIEHKLPLLTGRRA